MFIFNIVKDLQLHSFISSNTEALRSLVVAVSPIPFPPIANKKNILMFILLWPSHRQVIDRYLTDFSHASSYRKILRAMRILCGNQNAMVIAFCRFCNIIKLQFLYYFKNNVSRAKKL